MLVLARCDDRLIHGQCMTVITKEYDIKEIIVVDDFTVTNPILKTVFETAVPTTMVANVFTVNDAKIKIEEAMTNQIRTLLLMKSPEVYQALYEQIENLPKELNIGPMSNRSGTISATATAHLLACEADAIKHLVAKGVHVYFRQVPSQKSVEWDEIKQNF